MTTDNQKDQADTSANIYESFRIMNCRCPICDENTEIDLSQITSASHESDCTACDAPITIKRSPYSQREKKVTRYASCASCGNQLTDLQRCDTCGAVFPDFYEAVKSNRKKVVPGAEPKRKFSLLSISLIVILMLVTAGLCLFNYLNAREQYTDNYFRMLNAVIIGIDTNIKVSSSHKGDTKISSQEEAAVNRVKTVAARLEKDLANPPAGFGSMKDRLMVLYNVYQESNALLNHSAATQKELSEMQENLGKKRDAAIKEIKVALPSSFKTALVNAKAKYKGLKDF